MSAFIIKLIALLSMTIDHTFKLYPNFVSSLPDFQIPLPGITFSFLGLVSLLGRIAFPLYAFLVAEGCLHTRNLGKYIKRLFVFALISEIPFDLMFHGGIFLGGQNVMWTFLFGVSAVYFYEKFADKSFVGFFLAMICVLLSYVLKTDYRGYGALMVFVIYLAPSKGTKLFSMFLVICLMFLHTMGLFHAIKTAAVTSIITQCLRLFFTLLAIPVAASYNGERGIGMKWLFYAYYPIHIFVLGYLNTL